MSFISQIKKGFTLIELMVSIGIMMLITSTVLLNQGTYTSNISLTNMANDISLTIRQAQIYGVSVKELQPGSSDFSSAYGVEFNISDTGSKDAYIFFADLGGVNRTGIYDNGWPCQANNSPECLQKINLSSGNTITQLCILSKNDNGVCRSNPSQLTDRVDITFLRPSNSANIIYYNNGGQIRGNPNMQGVEITVTSTSSATRKVIVYTTGQISVK